MFAQKKSSVRERVNMMDEFRLLSPTAILGYGFPQESFEQGMSEKPHVIAVDAGSTDPGPYYLGSGKSFTDRAAVKRDLEIILQAAVPAGISVVIGSAGGSGGKVHVDWTINIVEEIPLKKGCHFLWPESTPNLHRKRLWISWQLI